MVQSERTVQSHAVAAYLEEEIVAGTLGAGARLDEVSIATRFGVSRTPVREALHILCGRSLAERVPYRGVVVAEISTKQIDEMFEAMAEIEALCGRLSSQRMTMGERAELERLHHEMNALAENGDAARYDDANTQFHNLIFDGCHNGDLIAIANTLRAKLAPFRKYQLKDLGRLRRSCQEHQQIVDAILEQDGRATETALRRHLISAAREVLLRRQKIYGEALNLV